MDASKAAKVLEDSLLERERHTANVLMDMGLRPRVGPQGDESTTGKKTRSGPRTKKTPRKTLPAPTWQGEQYFPSSTSGSSSEESQDTTEQRVGLQGDENTTGKKTRSGPRTKKTTRKTLPAPTGQGEPYCLSSISGPQGDENTTEKKTKSGPRTKKTPRKSLPAPTWQGEQYFPSSTSGSSSEESQDTTEQRKSVGYKAPRLTTAQALENLSKSSR